VTADDGDLGFTFRARANGDVEVLHRGRVAATLRGAKARAFIDRIATGAHRDGQQLMARVTGNYKRGNERTASGHLRNSHRWPPESATPASSR